MKYLSLGWAALYMALATFVVDADPLPISTDIPVSEQTLAALGAALPNSALSDQRGKAITSTNTNNVDGELYSNNASSTYSGGNAVTEGAFSNSTGLFTVIQNSGNNVLIQSATILNLEIK